MAVLAASSKLPSPTQACHPTTAAIDSSCSSISDQCLLHTVEPQSSIDSDSSRESEASPLRQHSCPGSSSKDRRKKLDNFRHGISLSPEMFAIHQSLRQNWESPNSSIALSLMVLVGVPLLAYGSLFPAGFSITNFVIAIWSAWDGLLSISSLLVMTVAFGGAFLFHYLASFVPKAPVCLSPLPVNKSDLEGTPTSKSNSARSSCKSAPVSDGIVYSRWSFASKVTSETDLSSVDSLENCCSFNMGSENEHSSLSSPNKNFVSRARTHVMKSRRMLFNAIGASILLFFLVMLGLILPNSLVYPSWMWHPFLWGRYRVYGTDAMGPALDRICTDPERGLCMDEWEWEVLSAGALSSHNQDDVLAVRAGQIYAKTKGIVVNVLARDIKDNIPALQMNVESLAHLFESVALVVFENDSSDGTREAFKAWAKVAGSRGYTVDLMECEGVVDCKLKREYRDDVQRDYDHSSAIGEMHTYRNKAIEHIKSNPKYKGFSHLLVLDGDLAVPFSPLGILHTLGKRPDNAVASSGRQPWPTAFGTFTTPYDLAGFREYNTPRTAGLEAWHRRFCGITSSNERWRNECNALGPTHLIAVLWNDRMSIQGDFYKVNSAFNGAVLYPITLLRESEARYDKGESGQRCEHIGFHQMINKHKPMYVNRKWDMHLKPNYPGGVAWGRASKTTNRIKRTPKLMLIILITHVITVGMFIWATFTLGVYAIQPAITWFVRSVTERHQTQRKSKILIRNNSIHFELDTEPRSSRKSISV